jgi:hypothetical protein
VHNPSIMLTFGLPALLGKSWKPSTLLTIQGLNKFLHLLSFNFSHFFTFRSINQPICYLNFYLCIYGGANAAPSTKENPPQPSNKSVYSFNQVAGNIVSLYSTAWPITCCYIGDPEFSSWRMTNRS